MGIKQKFFAQFSGPAGMLGRLAGFVMSVRPSNLERNRWGVALLDVKPADVILEIGFGPGLVIKELSRLIPEGKVYGVDYSQLMVEKASRRNRIAIQAGKVELFHASADTMPQFYLPVDKVIEINSLQFWPNPVNALMNIKKVMKTGGKIFLLHQPRNPDAVEKDTDELGLKISGYLNEAGFVNIRTEKRIMEPVPSVYVMGIKD